MLKLRCFLWVFCCWSWDGRFGKEFFLRWRVCTNWFDELHLEVSYLKFLFTSEIGRDFWLHRFPYGLWRFFPPAFDATKQKKPPRQKDWSCCSTGECISRKRMCLGTLDCSRSSREWMYTYISIYDYMSIYTSNEWMYIYMYIMYVSIYIYIYRCRMNSNDCILKYWSTRCRKKTWPLYLTEDMFWLQKNWSGKSWGFS